MGFYQFVKWNKTIAINWITTVYFDAIIVNQMHTHARTHARKKVIDVTISYMLHLVDKSTIPVSMIFSRQMHIFEFHLTFNGAVCVCVCERDVIYNQQISPL